MKKYLISLLFLALAAITGSSQENSQLKFVLFREAPDEGGYNLTKQMIENWPTAASDNSKDAALIRVKFENLPPVEAKEIVFTTSQNNFVNVDYTKLDQSRREVWLWIDPTGDTYINANSPRGYSARMTIHDPLEPGHIYDMVLRNDKTVSVAFNTIPAGAVITLETGQTTTTPELMHDVALGKHVAVISLNGRRMLVDTIEVAESALKFPVGQSAYDLRNKKQMQFKSEPEADLFIDGELVGKTPLSTDIAYGPHTFIAVAGPTATDTIPFNVSETSSNEIKLNPVKKIQFECVSYYGGRPVNGYLYVNGKIQDSNILRYPIGRTYNIEMSYGNASKKRKIKVKDGMNVRQEFKISAKNKITWPWEREYDAAPFGVAVGYVTKHWVTSGEGEKLQENIWGDDAWLNGMQFGIHFQPAFSWGLGIYTGLFYEVYLSWNDDSQDAIGYGQFMEHALYLPAHAYYRIPFARRVALSVHGGLGINWSISAHIQDQEGEYEDISLFDLDNQPKPFNLAAELGIDMRVGPVIVSFTYSKGLTNHKFYSEYGNYKTVQNKWGISASWAFGTNE